MSKRQLWYGFLEAGTKSSAVAIDQTLETGNPKTIYIYNLAKKEICEYNREIVEPKLRELKGDESQLLKDLEKGMASALKDFHPRGSRAEKIPERGASASAPAKASRRDDSEEELELIGADDDVEFDEEEDED